MADITGGAKLLRFLGLLLVHCEQLLTHGVGMGTNRLCPEGVVRRVDFVVRRVDFVARVGIKQHNLTRAESESVG